MKRSLPALRLSKSPLVIVLSQVRISAVLGMEKYIPEIQEELRRKGFPKFRTSISQEINLVPELKVVRSVRWLFTDKDDTTTAVIASNFVTLLTSKYEVFETFLKTFDVVLETVGRIAKVALAERVGLRYVDLIRVNEGESLEGYIQPGLLGLPADKLELREALHKFELVGVSDSGQLIVRLMEMNNGQFLPPDVDPADVKHSVKLKPGERVTLLDIDHFTSSQHDFEIADLNESLWKLHDLCDRAFRKAVTEEALKKWGATREAAKK